MVKILQCLTHSDTGGGQSVVYTLVKNLRKYKPDAEVSVMLPAGGTFVERFKKLNVRVIEFPLDRISIYNIHLFNQLLSKLNPSVIHSHGKGAGFYSRISTYFGKNMKRVHTYHGFHIPKNILNRNIYLQYEKIMISRTNAVIAISKSEGSELRSRFEHYSDRVSIVPNIVGHEELDKFSDIEIPQSIMNFIKSGKDKIVLMIARNDPVKNYPLALDAAELTLKQSSNVKFIFIGLSPNDEHYSGITEKYNDKILAIDSVEYSAPIIKKSDIIMLTSKKEGLPLVILEGYHFGLPAVGTRVPGLSEVIKDGSTGLLCDENSSSVSNAILSLCNNPDLYMQMKSNILKDIALDETESWVNRYYQIYSEPLE
ncbi:MAG: glycosyltransferase family 4 protein [Ignavibacteriales bacterium]|nr:glycosyltransferase family 4 protein [Ignavibacteriales bacterium]